MCCARALDRFIALPPRLNRLVSRILYPVWALIARALFLIAGVVVVDDDGVSWDERTRRRLAAETSHT